MWVQLFLRALKMTLFVVAIGCGTSACTNKEPIVDTGLTPPTDPATGAPTTTPYTGAAARRVDRGWRLVYDTAALNPGFDGSDLEEPAGR